MLKFARKQVKEKDPEGRMPLGEHLRELRNRLAKAVLAIVVVGIVALFWSDEIVGFLTDPVPKCVEGGTRTGGTCANLTYMDIMSPFSTTVKVAFLTGVVVSAPVWLYQLWAFIAPGLHRNEKKYTYWFVGVAAPLFVAGAYTAYVVLPVSFKVLLGITPDGFENLLSLDTILDFSVRMVLVFGVAFEVPLVMVMLNFAKVVTGKQMVRWWRAVLMGVFVFGAIATPSTDPVGMLALSGPIIVLYFIAVGIAMLNDKRRARKDPDAQLDDDEASELDLTPEAVGEIEPVGARRALPEQANGSAPRQLNGYDDIT
ncbi:twin-arginine translocase subunit TatC [Streptomyces sp. NPDC087440]|uniref:twin-arginine translocase subunit TatC n=1 Tax=Streptomyces sp. NPDC087440 TaxID=3365790 RepID=UPI00381AC26C